MSVACLKKYSEALLEVIPAYREAGGEWPPTSRELALFAINNGYWQLGPSKKVSMCATEISRAMRKQKHTDSQGRSVRTMHAAKSVRVDDDGTERQLVLWDDIHTADPSYMEVAFQQRRTRLVNGCHQLKTDVDSFNDERPSGEPIQMVFDFRDDLEELAQSSESLRRGRPR